MDDVKLGKTIAWSTKIVSAYLSRNALPASEIPGLIGVTHAALLGLENAPAARPPSDPPKPAVSVRKSVTDDYLVCLEDGRRFKSLRRHLRVRYGMTPEQYRLKWQLPPDYPMVAPGYAQRRSAMAKSMGLGRREPD